MKPFAACLMFIWAAPALAHPGVGIVQDRKGNVYFTDLKQVWKITPEGKLSIAVPAVHTHELYLDTDDNLYGEHLRYEGEATDKWNHRVWRLKPDGTLSDVIPTTEGFLRNYSFVRDGTGTMYWTEGGEETIIMKRTRDGSSTQHARGGLRRVGWMTATANGTLYLMDTGHLKRVSPNGTIKTISSRLSSKDPSPHSVTNRHYHMGLWTDQRGQVYVAIAAERVVVCVTPEGTASVIATSSAPWSPSGGMIDRDCNLWLLEYDTSNTSRARRVGKDGQDRVFVGQAPR